MGAVYRAWDMRLSVPVALKEMTPQPGLNAQTVGQLREQFQQEAKVLAGLHHPHLVRVTDFFEEAGNAYLVMDFVEGESLADRIAQRGPLPEAEVLIWAKQLLSALTYCHDRGIIHRDIKPQNVVIRSDGQAVLVDFGLVKLWDPNDPRTKTVMRGAGTPEYAPPEQYEADTKHTDPRSDIYSIGATLYHAMAGQAPLTATLRMASPERFVQVRNLNPGVSQATEQAVNRALELNQSKRWQSAEEMVTALGIGDVPIPVQHPRHVTPATPIRDEVSATPSVQAAAAPARRRVPVAKILVGAGILFVLLCLGFMCVFGRLVREGEKIQTATAQAEIIIQQAHETATAQAQATSTAQALEAAGTVQAQATAKAESAATATALAQPTAPPPNGATATVQACIHHTALAPADWSVALCDTFTTNENEWFTGEFEGDLISGEKLLADGKYRWDATSNENAIWWSIPAVTLDDDFYATVEIRRVSGVDTGQYGMVFRKIDEDNYALFKIQDSQLFKFSLKHEGEWDTVIDWTETSAVFPGKVNRVTILAQDTHYTFYVNDIYVGEAEDDRLSQGKVGLVIELVEVGDTAVFEFDNLEIRAP
jgi:serine/threonine-protein kinase